MEYSNYILFAVGVFGILVHNLIKIDAINRKENGGFKFGPFLRLEWPSILISFCVVVVCLMVKQEVKKLDQVGNWLGLGFFAIGYMAQSIVYKLIGKAEKRLSGK